LISFGAVSAGEGCEPAAGRGSESGSFCLFVMVAGDMKSGINRVFAVTGYYPAVTRSEQGKTPDFRIFAGEIGAVCAPPSKRF